MSEDLSKHTTPHPASASHLWGQRDKYGVETCLRCGWRRQEVTREDYAFDHPGPIVVGYQYLEPKVKPGERQTIRSWSWDVLADCRERSE